MAKTCWAKALGDCSVKMSREHIITEKLFFEATFIKLEKVKHTDDGKLSLKRNNFASKILCKSHNERLSPVDREAIKLFEHFKNIHRKIRLQESFEEQAFVYPVNKRLIERWLLKTLINFVAADFFELGKPIRRGGQVVDNRLVDIAFGNRHFNGFSGAYIVDCFEAISAWGDHFHFTPLITEEGVVGGMFFRFCGIWFVLWLTEGVPMPGSVFNKGLMKGRDVFHTPVSVKAATDGARNFYLEFI